MSHASWPIKFATNSWFFFVLDRDKLARLVPTVGMVERSEAPSSSLSAPTPSDTALCTWRCLRRTDLPQPEVPTQRIMMKSRWKASEIGLAIMASGLVLIKLEHDPMSTLTVSLAQFRQENMYGSLPDSWLKWRPCLREETTPSISKFKLFSY